MTLELSNIIAPLMGGIIGYITNDIAIRMLFRPHTAKYVFGVHLPFTPGLIPNEKGRIAEEIGGVISQNLMNHEVLQRYLLSEEMILKVHSSVEDFFESQKKNKETTEEFLLHYLSSDEINNIVNGIKVNTSLQIKEKLNSPELGKTISHLAMEHVAKKLNNSSAKELLDELGGPIIAKLGGNFVGKIFEMLREPTEKLLANNINKIMQENGEEIVSNIIGDESNKLLSTPMYSLLSNKDDQIVQIVSAIESIYRTIIEKHLPIILSSIDISKIVRERINEMDINETEKIILQVMKKELNAIVWFGALLGFLIGSLNLVIS